MTKRLPVCLVGCGGMGHRHIAGLSALVGTGLANVEIVAVCDLDAGRAESAAESAANLLGRRPRVHTHIDSVLTDPAIAAIDVTTDVTAHLPVVLPALAAGKPVLCEKPLGLTVRACHAMTQAAARTGTLLATAENFRRDPVNRLAKAVIDHGLLGHIHLMSQFAVGGDDRIMITPWRHLRERGAVGLDVGVHYLDIIQYYFGPFESVAGHGFIAEPVRFNRAGALLPHPAYREQAAAYPPSVQATGEDSLVATLRMRSGVLIQLSYIPSGPGHAWYRRSLHGRLGSIEIPRDRTGGAASLYREGAVLSGREILREIPGFQHDEITARLFGRDCVSYAMSFPEADARLIAIELHDFASAVFDGRPPEVTGEDGRAAVAALLGIYESGLAGRPVSMDELLAGAVSDYQDDLDRHIGLLN